jgi:hypothetical protein
LNAYLKWFRVVTWIGFVVNLGFVLPALFAPDLLEATLGPGSAALSYVWLADAGLALLIASLFYLPAAADPLRYRTYAWLSVLGRAIAAVFWLWQDLRWHPPGPIGTFFLTDGAFGLVFLVLLWLGFRKTPATAPAAGSALPLAGQEEGDSGRLLWFKRVMWLGIVLDLLYAVLALAVPAALAGWIGASFVLFTYIWLGNTGLLLVQGVMFFVPAARDPLRYPTHAWLAVLARVLTTAFWLWQGARWSLPGVWLGVIVVEGLLAIVLAVLLQQGLPPSLRLGWERARGWLERKRSGLTQALSRPAVAAVTLLVAVVLGWAGYELYANLIEAEPDETFADPAEQFKYGAIGLGMASRVPTYVFEVLPELCPDLLPGPGGWASLGLLYEPGHALPIGFARRRIGYPSVEPNCALCHTSSYRTAEGAPAQFILGGPAHELDLESFQRFLYKCAGSSRFAPGAVVAQIRKHHQLGWVEAALYRFAIVPITRNSLALQETEYAWQKSRPQQGKGRTDTFNPTKITVFHLPDDGSIGTVDLPAIWNQRAREGLYLHWDGNNNEIRERNFAAAMAIGASPDSVLLDHFNAVTSFVLTLPPPAFPFPVQAEKVQRGWPLFEANCASCHGFGTQKVGTVTAQTEVATDAHRLESFTPALVRSFHSIDEPPFYFDAYRKTEGYSNLPIDGTWARAPYLHNGSVPTLWDLLQPAEKRPVRFYRGYNVYDPVKMGYVSDGEKAKAVGFDLDTTLPGNANVGHLYGTQLTDAEKWDLIEFLKTQ